MFSNDGCKCVGDDSLSNTELMEKAVEEGQRFWSAGLAELAYLSIRDAVVEVLRRDNSSESG